MALFRKDPRRELDRAEDFLSEGRVVRALEIARRIEKAGRPPFWKEAADLVARARQNLFDNALQRAGEAEKEGQIEDAVDWLLAAAQHAPDDKEASDVRRKVAALEAGERQLPELEAESDSRDDDPEPGIAVDLEFHYQTLVDTLDDDVAKHYRELPEAFQRAFANLNDGNVDSALEPLEDLVEENPDETVYRFERGRCRLLLGDPQGAGEDFDAVWGTVGDDHLDRARQVSVPGLWAEAMLALGRSGEVVERLEDLSDPSFGDPARTLIYLQALVMEENLSEARQGLMRAIDLLSARRDFFALMAWVLEREGERRQAIEFLESKLLSDRDSHGNPTFHLPTLRTLIELRLNEGEDLDRVRELMGFLVEAQRGRGDFPDHILLSRYHAAIGETESATKAAEAAEELYDPEEAALEAIQRGLRPDRPEPPPK